MIHHADISETEKVIYQNDISNTEYENEYEIETENENAIEEVKQSEWNRTKSKFYNSKKWKSNLLLKWNITENDLNESMSKFIELCELRNDKKKYAALCKHFTNYYLKTKQNETDKRNNQKPKFGTAIREASNRFGEIGNAFGKDIAK